MRYISHEFRLAPFAGIVRDVSEAGNQDSTLWVDPANEALLLFFACGFEITSNIRHFRVVKPSGSPSR